MKKMNSAMLSIMTFLGNIGNKLTNSNVAKTMVSFGSKVKTKIGERINTLFEKLGFKKPKNRKKKIKVLKKVEKAVEKEIEKLEEEEKL